MAGFFTIIIIIQTLYIVSFSRYVAAIYRWQHSLGLVTFILVTPDLAFLRRVTISLVTFDFST